MHFWQQREITDRLIAERAARRERMEQIEDQAQAMADFMAGLIAFDFNPRMITQTRIEECDG